MKDSIQILYEDDVLLAVNKPARVASVPAEGISLGRTMLGAVERLCADRGDQAKPYLLHRLDMQTSGVLMFGKFERDRATLEAIFSAKDKGTSEKTRTIKKYITLVKGLPKGSEIVTKLKARASDEKISAKTKYRVLRVYKVLGTVVSLVEVEILTGRKHQIRQHFANIKSPVVMDSLYGDEDFNKEFRIKFRLGRQFLHAASLEFLHPMVGRRLRIEAKLPLDLEGVLKKMGAEKEV